VRNTTLKRFDVPRTPLPRVYVELTNRCNFSCEFCPNPVMERAGGQMEWPLLERVLDEIAAGDLARLVLFHQQGEPTLHPRLPDAVRLAARLGLRPCVTTNGSTLDDRLVDALLDAGLHRLTISLQTPDERSFAIRGARNLSYAAFEERVARGVRRVLAAAGAATEVSVAFLTNPFGRLALPTIGRDWSIVASDGDLRAILRAWARRCLDGIAGAPAPEREIARARAAFPNLLRLAPRLLFETRQVGEWPAPPAAGGGPWFEARAGTCHGLTDHFAVLWDGRYSYCCVDYDGHTGGAARFQDVSILDWLASKPVQRAIRGFERWSPEHPYCRRCLGGSTRAIALGKAVGSIAYFKLYRPLLASEAPLPP
jgi:hypothetical protein